MITRKGTSTDVFIGGTIEVLADEVDFDKSYSFEETIDGKTFTWTGVVPSGIVRKTIGIWRSLFFRISY